MKTPNSVIIYSTPKLTSAKHRDIYKKIVEKVENRSCGRKWYLWIHFYLGARQGYEYE